MQVDTELVYAYAKTEDMGALEEFISGTHQANLQSVGDRVFDEGMFEAARAIFAHIPNWGRLASTLVRLHQFQQAVDAARKANSPKTWKEVNHLGAQPRLKQCCLSSSASVQQILALSSPDSCRHCSHTKAGQHLRHMQLCGVNGATLRARLMILMLV